MRADGDRLGRLATMIDYGELKVHVDAVYSFENAPKAFARVLRSTYISDDQRGRVWRVVRK